jgi:hypothetical protein
MSGISHVSELKLEVLTLKLETLILETFLLRLTSASQYGQQMVLHTHNLEMTNCNGKVKN